MKAKAENDSLNPFEAIELLISKNKLEFTHINEVINQFLNRLQKLCPKCPNVPVGQRRSKGKRHILNVINVNCQRSYELPVTYWKCNNINEITTILEALKLNKKNESLVPMINDRNGSKCYICGKIGHLAHMPNVFIYLDDIVIGSVSVEQHKLDIDSFTNWNQSWCMAPLNYPEIEGISCERGF
ncbi:hypothetical protein A3Q56_08071, partial [Intoshia linei]